MAWSEGATGVAPHHLLDDGYPPDPCALLVIGCGNILRGDDAVGPVAVRHLVDDGLPDGVRVVDGGTAGMDVAFAMRGARRVVIVDAAATGADPGTVFRVPAEELTDLPPLDGLHSHNLRWDHALSFGSWLLGPERPTDITVYLVEGASYEPGAPLSAAVEAGMEQVLAMVRRDHYPEPDPHDDRASTSRDLVEITDSGSLRIPADLAGRYAPSDSLLARLEGVEGSDRVLVLVPLHSAAHGGLVLRQYTPAGDRAVVVSEVFDFAPVAGTFEVSWDEARGALVVDLEHPVTDGGADGDRGDHRGGTGARPVDGLSPRDEPGRGGAAETAHAPERATGPAGRGGGRPDGGAAPAPEAGAR